MKRRLAIARLWYEGNSFSPALTGLAAFRAREWVKGTAAQDFYRNTATEIGAAVTFAETHDDWACHFLLCAAAPPGGLMSAEAFSIIRDDMLNGLVEGQKDGKWNAVYLSLHGATVVVGNPTPELELLRAIRSVIGDTPLGVSFDLHAHLSPEMLALVDIAAGYKTYPHIDMDATARLVLDAVTAQAAGKLAPKQAIGKLPAILPSFNMRTTDGPMAELQAHAQIWRERPGMIDVSLFGGFAYGDSPFAGPSVIACADQDVELAQAAVDDLLQEMAARRDRFYITLPDPRAGLLEAIKTHGDKPVAVIDPADNPLSGGIGDTPELFRALLDLRPNVPTVFGFFWDPDLVARCWQAGSGATITANLGGRVSQEFGAPVKVTARIEKLTDGQFRN
ncbi:MAG TPA: M81 family metallopeptidase, partial [Dongiaceae bacterium]|nr:M81 family metallopeptidase [Dongiaceae bacterium]